MKIANIILIGLIVTVIALFVWKKDGDNGLEKLNTTQPVIGTIENIRLITGNLYPETEISVKSSISGVIEMIYVEEGDQVRAGDKIAKIQMVPDPTEIEALQKHLATAKIKYETEKKAYERKNRLFEKGFIAEAEYEKEKQQYELSKAEYESAKNRLELTLEGEASGIKDITNIVKAPTDGTILDIPVKRGASVIKRNNFNQGTNIALIAKLDSFVFRGKVNESELAHLYPGMPLTLSVNALEGYEASGILTKISPKGEKEQGIMKYQIEAKVDIAQDTITIRAGYTATAKIILQKRPDVLTMEEKHLIFENDSAFVEILNDEGEYEKKHIKTGVSDGIKIEITKGLNTDDKVKKQG